MKRLLLVPALLLALVGCGDSGHDGQDIKDGNTLEVENNSGAYIEIQKVTYNGKPLYCIKYNRGLSCDWVQYHKENG